MKSGNLEALKSVIHENDICYIAEINKFRLFRQRRPDEYMYVIPIAFFRYFNFVYGVENPDTWFSLLASMNRMRLNDDFEYDVELTKGQKSIGMGEMM